MTSIEHPHATTPAPDVSLHFVNTGQGDCTLVVDRVGAAAVLIDCHPAARDKVKQLLTAERATLALVVVTHFHADHFGAIGEFVNEHRSASVRYNPPSMPANADERKRLRALLRTLKARAEQGLGGPISRGDTGSRGPLSWECLSPTFALLTSAAAESDENKASVVLRLQLGNLAILVTGDADYEAWESMLAGGLLPVDILRVPHHGGRLRQPPSYAEAAVLEALRPRYVVLSVGSVNKYGHPAIEWVVPAARASHLMCTAVTPLCEPRVGRETPCAGDVAISWWLNDQWEVSPSRAEHEAVIAGWEHPACRQQ